MPISSPGPESDGAWRRNSRRNGITLGAVVAIVIGGAVAVSAGDGGRRDDDGGSALFPTNEEATAPDSAVTIAGAPDSTVPASSTTDSSTTTSSSTTTTTTTTTTVDPADVAHAFPVDPQVNSSYTPAAHSNYRATDVFSSAGCGTALLSPVTGAIDEVVTNTWDSAVDDPATRGGNAVSILGDDGVRYYLAHFQLIDPAIVNGARVVAGDYLGEMGQTGRAGACHVHFGLSLDCPDDDWWVRRGVVWPDPYLTSWRDGGNLSPLPELQGWFAEYPNACDSVEGTPYPRG